MKQTAVEWLFLMINNPNKDQDFANKLFNKAKEMEKQQIIDAWRDGRSDQQSKDGKFYNRNAEYYYNETYKMKTEDICKLLEFIRTEPKLEQVQDGFLYHGLYFTNEQLIQMFYERINSINNSVGSTERNSN